jgi:hypothetical protein
MFLESQMSRHPVLIVSVDDSSGPAANWPPPLLDKFKRLRSATLLSDNLSLVEASPLKIDSTELVARIIRWLTAEMDWPRLPIQESLNGWSDVWPEFTKQPGIHAIGQNIQFSLVPSDTLIAASKKRVTEANLLLEQTVMSRENLKFEERRAKNDRRALASINIQKKELSTRETQVERSREVSNRIHQRLVELRDRFLVVKCCPCCKSHLVEKQADANMMICLDCDSEWGRRTCPDCHTDYAFIVPHDSAAIAPLETFDSLRMFGADMCAPLLPPTSAPFLARSTECPRCRGTKISAAINASQHDA